MGPPQRQSQCLTLQFAIMSRQSYRIHQWHPVPISLTNDPRTTLLTLNPVILLESCLQEVVMGPSAKTHTLITPHPNPPTRLYDRDNIQSPRKHDQSQICQGLNHKQEIPHSYRTLRRRQYRLFRGREHMAP